MAIALGTELSSKLLLWDDLTPSDRARRLWTFMGVHLKRGAEMVREPRAFDLKHAGTLRSLLEVLAYKHGVLFARDLPPLVDRPVAIDMRDACYTYSEPRFSIAGECGGYVRHFRDDVIETPWPD